jgi:predicted SprT family Zn-dependent metalloprotease
MNENWRDKEIVVMPHLKNPTETVSVKTKVYTSLGLAIKEANKNNTYVGIYEYSGLFIEKLIKDMRIYDMDTRWLEEISNSRLEFERIGPDGIAFARNNSIAINVDNRIFIGEAERDERELQAIVLHELRHIWQEQSGVWAGNMRRRRMRDGKDYKNILIEVEAFDIQFKFEKKSGKEINHERVNKIRDYFNANTSEALRAKHLMLPIHLQANTYYIYGRGYYFDDTDVGIMTYGGEAGHYREYTDGNMTYVAYEVLADISQ